MVLPGTCFQCRGANSILKPHCNRAGFVSSFWAQREDDPEIEFQVFFKVTGEFIRQEEHRALSTLGDVAGQDVDTVPIAIGNLLETFVGTLIASENGTDVGQRQLAVRREHARRTYPEGDFRIGISDGFLNLLAHLPLDSFISPCFLVGATLG